MAGLSLLTFLTFGLMVAGAHASDPVSQGWSRSHEFTELIGRPVRNSQGEYLGRVKNFVFDPNGRVTFAIISHETFWRFTEKSIAVPFEALSINPIGRGLTLNISKEKFESAPKFTAEDLVNRQRAGEIYKYYGLQPYWTEEGGGGGGAGDAVMNAPEKGPQKEKGKQDSPYDFDYMWR